VAQGDFADKVNFVGRGAGGGPTASAVVAEAPTRRANGWKWK